MTETAREIADVIMDATGSELGFTRWRRWDAAVKHRDAIEAAILAAERRGIERAAEVVQTFGATDGGILCLGIDELYDAILALLPEGDGRPFSADEAILKAIEIDDPDERLAFLVDWSEGIWPLPNPPTAKE